MVTTLLLLFALQLPPAPTRYVTDNAGVLPRDRVEAIDEKLRAFDDKTTNQVIVYIDRRLPAGATLEETATAAFRQWGVGQKGKNNGVVLFLFTQDRKMRIEVGSGLTTTLTDAKAHDILEQMKPRLRKEDYAGAVSLGVDDILAVTQGKPIPRNGVGRLTSAMGVLGIAAFGIVFLGIAGVVIAVVVAKSWGGDGGSSSDSSSSDSSSSSGGDFSGGGGSSDGGGASGSW